MLARRAPGVLRFLRLPCRWQTSGSPSPPSNDDFLTADDFQKDNEMVAAENMSPEERLLDPKNPPDLSWQQYRRLKGIDFSERESLQSKRYQEQHDEWQSELDAMRKATEQGYSTSSQDLSRIQAHKLRAGQPGANVHVDNMNATTTEGLAAELTGEQGVFMEQTDVPAQDYFNPALFPEILDAGKWLPKRVKGKCIFCMPDPTQKHVKDITFTNVQLLHGFINERGMITSRRWNFNCHKHQKKLAKAIRRARVLGFLNPTDNFFAPESFANTDLGDLAKLSDSGDLGLYGIGMTPTKSSGTRRPSPTVAAVGIQAVMETEGAPPADNSSADQGGRLVRAKKSLSDVIE